MLLLIDSIQLIKAFIVYRKGAGTKFVRMVNDLLTMHFVDK